MPHICPRELLGPTAFPPKPRGRNLSVTLEEENPQGNGRAHPRLSEHEAGTLPGLAAGFGEPTGARSLGPGRLRRISPGKRRPQRPAGISKAIVPPCAPREPWAPSDTSGPRDTDG